MGVMLQNLVSDYECKSGEKVEFDTLHFIHSEGLVQYIDGFKNFLKA